MTEPAPDAARALVDAFWRAADQTEQDAAREDLLAQAPSVEILYRWLRQGPEFSADAPVGEIQAERTAADGTRFPYVLLVPASYDPGQSYPVEFMLHGGVSREKPAPGAVLWRDGYDSLRRDDRIVVVPAAWKDAIWWQGSQAENLPAILADLKRTYNIDDNRVSLIGVSDGGTGAWFFAFKQPTPWAGFYPYISHPGVLRNDRSGGGYRLYFENLLGKPLYIVNGELDQLYPAASLTSFVGILADAGVEHVFRVIEDSGHNTRWLAQETSAIERFKQTHPRDPFPETVQWVADRDDRYNRNHWVRIDTLSLADRPSLLRASRTGNTIQVTTRGVSRFTLLLNPEEVDFSSPLLVSINGRVVLAEPVAQEAETLLDGAARERDRTLLYTAALTLDVPEA